MGIGPYGRNVTLGKALSNVSKICGLCKVTHRGVWIDLLLGTQATFFSLQPFLRVGHAWDNWTQNHLSIARRQYSRYISPKILQNTLQQFAYSSLGLLNHPGKTCFLRCTVYRQVLSASQILRYWPGIIYMLEICLLTQEYGLTSLFELHGSEA